MTHIAVVAFVMAVTVAHAQQPELNQKAFEPTYRAAKAIEAATGTGLTFAKYRELLQALATEANILKDQRLTGEQNERLLALFIDVLGHYDAASVFWEAKIKAPTRGPSKPFKGIPVYYEKQKTNDSLLKLAEAYKLPIEHANAGGAIAGKLEYRYVPDDVPQHIFGIAADTLKKASDVYFGR